MSESSLELKNLALELRKRSPEDNFNELINLVGEVVQGDRAADIVDMMEAIASDSQTLEGTILGFIHAPAAKRNHHAYIGGLVVHLLEMWAVWEERFRQDFEQTTEINDRRILEGVIFHDLHKAFETFIAMKPSPGLESQIIYLRDDPDNESLTWATKTLWILQWHEIPLDNRQYSALLWSEGGWAETPPKWCSVLAKVLYLMDEYSGNVLSRMQDSTWRGVWEKKCSSAM